MFCCDSCWTQTTLQAASWKTLKSSAKTTIKERKKLHKWYVNPTIFGFALVKSQHFE
jgi:hypothetical protein